MTDRNAFVDALDGRDVLVHLARGPTTDAAWTEGHEASGGRFDDAYETARHDGLDRVVVASSNHVTGMYNRRDPIGDETMVAEPTRAVVPETHQGRTPTTGW